MHQCKGFSLIELMIASLLGIMVVGGAISVYITTIRGSSDAVKSARLNYDLESAAQLMGNELKRSGYWGGAKVGNDTLNNPAMLGVANITLEDYSGDGAIDCILYSYDANNDELIGLDEYFGFRHNGDGIDMRFSIDSVGDVACTDTDTTWGNIIDTSKLKITELIFSLANTKCFNVTTGEDIPSTCDAAANATTAGTAAAGEEVSSGDRAVETRQILISLKGEVLSDEQVTKNYTLAGGNDNRIRVKVRNNRVLIQP